MTGPRQLAVAPAGPKGTDAIVTASRVLIVDDSLVARSSIQRIVEAMPGFTVAASIASAQAAMAYLADHVVDIIVLDIEMPDRSGLDALPELLALSGDARVLVLSSHCGDGAPVTIKALALGASDTLSKPDRQFYPQDFATAFHARLRLLADARQTRREPVPLVLARPVAPPSPLSCIAIGSSTGGISAIHELLTALDPRLTAPILITQHLPTEFMPHFARHIDDLGLRPAQLATHGRRLERGHVYCAPGDAHLTLERHNGEVRMVLLSTWPNTAYRPSVDPMFQSVANCFGASAAAIMLSGMGSDGIQGAHAIAAQGAPIYVQDIQSSTVWGMPGAVARAGLASVILPPAGIARFMAECWLENA